MSRYRISRATKRKKREKRKKRKKRKKGEKNPPDRFEGRRLGQVLLLGVLEASQAFGVDADPDLVESLRALTVHDNQVRLRGLLHHPSRGPARRLAS